MSGEGAYLHGGRWNSPGKRVVYMSETLSLAAYELLVHVPFAVLRPYKRIEVQIPESSLMRLDDSELPWDWSEVGNPDLVAIGDAWIERGESLGLSVPSVLIPGERNVMLRPDHPDFSQVVFGEILAFYYDPRLTGLS